MKVNRKTFKLFFKMPSIISIKFYVGAADDDTASIMIVASQPSYPFYIR